uniref:Peptidyl-prolyl cis-trans isomerase n=1 Tax=Physcomitrium patens TaxID=3218 RepID=A9S8E8_PHYPA|nr:peptidyl-prolyl cis-trans isomerase-like [Physcomitrium patens]PNR43474.1 hypothetical protein PHYPA_015855 [Physcomitrium patens]|eukprot:XP_024391685.1 peptidyl-prolyl cis-trans isomerase-like [Physcomitrella patens]
MAPKKPKLSPRKLSVTSQKSKLTQKPDGASVGISHSPIVEPPLEKPNPIVFIDVKIGGQEVGRLFVELYEHIVPKTADNFLKLCTGVKGLGKQGIKLTYRRTVFFRIIPGVYAQGGDIIKNDGTGGESTFDGIPFEDENFRVSNARIGSLAMCNTGPNTNESQFFINLAPNPDLDGSHVVFGQVKEECRPVLKAMEAAGSWTGRTHQKVSVKSCGWVNKPSKELSGMSEETAEAVRLKTEVAAVGTADEH